MAIPVAIAPANERELALRRIVAARPRQLWCSWAEADLFKLWFCPRPWFVSHAEIELRAGGTCFAEMCGPSGERHTHRGVFLEAAENRKIVLTDAFVSAWEPSEKPFIVATVTLEDHPGGTLYTVRVGHWSVEDRERHEAMGFSQSWGIVIDQIEHVANTLSQA